AAGTEDGNAVVLAIAHEAAPVRGLRDAVGQEGLAGTSAACAPGAVELARGRVLVHAAVTVAVGDVEIALRPHREIGRPVEGRPGARHRARVLAIVTRVGRLVHGA